MKKNFIVLTAFVCYSAWAFAQSSYTSMGARAHGLGHASSCLADEWSVLNNIGGLAKVERATASFTYDALPRFRPFNKLAAVVALPVSMGVAGIGVFRFGDDLYSEQVLTAGFANTFGIASLGGKINYVQYQASGFGTKGVMTFSFGGIARLTKQLSIGAHIVNLNQPEISSDDGERLPTILSAGVAFTPSDKVFVTVEIEKDLDYDILWKAAVEYSVHKKFIFRTGVNLHPQAGFVGFGFRPSKFRFDYAYAYQPLTGSRHQATVGCALKRNVK